MVCIQSKLVNYGNERCEREQKGQSELHFHYKLHYILSTMLVISQMALFYYV